MSVLSRLKDHYYVYKMLLQNVQMMIRENTLDCACKNIHARQFEGVLEAIRRVDYMLSWVMSIFVIDLYLIIYLV